MYFSNIIYIIYYTLVRYFLVPFIDIRAIFCSIHLVVFTFKLSSLVPFINHNRSILYCKRRGFLHTEKILLIFIRLLIAILLTY